MNERVSYVIGTYPSLTTTFIDREIEALRDLGVDLQVVSLKHTPGSLSPAQLDAARTVRYLLPARPVDMLRAHLWALARHPRAYAGSLATLVRAPHRGASRSRTLLHFLEGVGTAWLLRDRAGVRLHAHFVDRAASVALVASRLLGTTYSVTAHANDIYVEPVLLPEKVRNATLAVTCTQYNREYLVSTLGPWSETRVRCIHHGLRLDTFVPSDRAPDGPPLVACVAQLKEKKGLTHLVRAVADLRDAGIDVRCEIAGDGPMRAELAHLIEELHVGDRVRLLGAIPGTDVRALLDRAAMFVLPSIIAADGDRDGIPNVILEAMAMGLPVISTTVSGIPEAVTDGETGRLVSPGDVSALSSAIRELAADAAERHRLGAEGRRRALELFDVRQSAARLLEAWRATAPHHRPVA